MFSASKDNLSNGMTLQQAHAVRGFKLTAAAGVVMYHSLFSNFMTLYVHRLGFSPVLIGTIFLGIQLPVFAQIWAARYVDRRGGKRLFNQMFTWGPLCLIPFILAPQFGQWLGEWAAVVGVFAGLIAFALANAVAAATWFPLVRHNLPPGRSTELVGAINQVATLIGLIVISGFGILLGERGPMWCYQLIFITAALLAWSRTITMRKVEDTPPQPPAPRRMYHDLLAVLADPPFRRLLVVVGLINLAVGVVVPFRPLYATALGFSERFAALSAVSLGMAVFALMSPVSGRLADRFGSRGLYVIGGTVAAASYAAIILPRGAGLLDGVILILGFSVFSAGWAGIDSATVRRLFLVVPRRNQSLYMVMYLIVSSLFGSLGSFMGGAIVQTVDAFAPGPEATGRFALALSYRVIFMVTVALLVIAIGYSRRMRDLKEASTPRLLTYMLLRTQRWLVTGSPGVFLRLGREEEEKPDAGE